MGLAGCTPPWSRPQSIAEAQRFLTPATFPGGSVVDPAGGVVALPGTSARRAAVTSYRVPADHPLHPYLGRRSFIYDDALAMIAATLSGQRAEARALGEMLSALVTPRGEFGFSFELAERGFYDRDYVRTGAVAWAGYALARYDQVTGERRFRDLARRIADGLLAQRVRGAGDLRAGLIPAGHGRWLDEYTRFDHAFVADYCVTEHQFDAWFLLHTLATLEPAGAYARAADELAARVMSSLWLPERRFAVGATAERVLPTAALDAAGSWGTLFLLARGDDTRARQALAYTRTTFATRHDGIDGYAPYAHPVPDHPGQDLSHTLSGEGTASVGIALLRLGRRAEAAQIAEQLTILQRQGGGGLTYALPGSPEFPDLPSAAATAWLLFLQLELAGALPTVFAPS